MSWRLGGVGTWGFMSKLIIVRSTGSYYVCCRNYMYCTLVRQVVVTVLRNSWGAGWNYVGFHVALTWISIWCGRYHY